MTNFEELRNTTKFLSEPGFYAITDGQFGSTGKGLLASVLAQAFPNRVDAVTSNAGPNSGHTSYAGSHKVVLQQLPTFAVMHRLFHGSMPDVFLNAGAVIEPSLLNAEIDKYAGPHGRVFLHKNAALVTKEGQGLEKDSLVERIGSTGKGTGTALAAKIMRDKEATVEVCYNQMNGALRLYSDIHRFVAGKIMLAEVSQGFSLSLNAGGFYPYCTSRDCTVAQALSDAGLHPSAYKGCAMVVRTFPIRVAGNSGPGYGDQQEISWEQLGQTPEITTVTKKIRRVFTWSHQQFVQALRHNRPEVLFVNFMNYLDCDEEKWLNENIYMPYYAVMNKNPECVLLGYGPRNEDVVIHKRSA